MDNSKLKKPEHLNEEAWLQHLREMALLDEQAHENYTEHLAHGQRDADSSKASLQAQYKALHDDHDIAES